MSQRGARQAYRQRAPLAERPFAEQRERQGLRRFRRRGLAGARLEYSLHCVASNLKLVASGSLGLQLHVGILVYFLTPGPTTLCCGGTLVCLTTLMNHLPLIAKSFFDSLNLTGEGPSAAGRQAQSQSAFIDSPKGRED